MLHGYSTLFCNQFNKVIILDSYWATYHDFNALKVFINWCSINFFAQWIQFIDNNSLIEKSTGWKWGNGSQYTFVMYHFLSSVSLKYPAAQIMDVWIFCTLRLLKPISELKCTMSFFPIQYEWMCSFYQIMYYLFWCIHLSYWLRANSLRYKDFLY